MQLTPSDIYLHFKPSECDLRVYLNHQGVKGAEASPYSEALKRLGKRHELAHRDTLGDFEDLSQSTAEQTKAAVTAGVNVIYQPLLKCTVRIAGIDCEVSGRPDFLIKDNLGYRIRDSKISRRITEKEHPEIILQLQTYGWLFERMFGLPASALEVHSGPGEIVEVAYAGPEPVINALREIVRIKKLDGRALRSCRVHALWRLWLSRSLLGESGSQSGGGAGQRVGQRHRARAARTKHSHDGSTPFRV